ncbi:MAG: hypothetical protein KJ737_15615 [Proteobacteria bacterium]|nr:hypothetical protein [Pseudomonadota bacterium]
MEVSGTNIGASTYALKKAMEMPGILMNLVQNSAENKGQSLEMNRPVPNPPDISSVTGKGKIIDIVA